jgi:hypothetical protein
MVSLLALRSELEPVDADNTPPVIFNHGGCAAREASLGVSKYLTLLPFSTAAAFWLFVKQHQNIPTSRYVRVQKTPDQQRDLKLTGNEQ